jgi:hypothetical protein
VEVNKSIFKRQADFLEKNGKYILQFTKPIDQESTGFIYLTLTFPYDKLNKKEEVKYVRISSE